MNNAEPFIAQMNEATQAGFELHRCINFPSDLNVKSEAQWLLC